MSASMIETVARGICAFQIPEGGFTFQGKPVPREELIELTWRQYLPIARVAIENMRKATQGMIVAACETGLFSDGAGYVDSDRQGKWDASNVWEAMIDAALKEQPTTGGLPGTPAPNVEGSGTA